MDRLRTPFFVLAVFCLVAAVGLEIGSGALVGGSSATSTFRSTIETSGLAGELDEIPADEVSTPPGLATRYLALIDGLLLFSAAMLVAGLLLSTRLYGRLQGIVTLIVSIVWLLLSLLLALAALLLLVLMVGLFVSTPFGTMAYLAAWGFFPRGEAALVLGVILALKLAFGGLLVAAHQRFLQNKGLVLLFATSLVLQLVLSFLHGLVPRVVISIADALWAIVVAIVAVVWAVVFLIGAIVGVVNALRVSTSAT